MPETRGDNANGRRLIDEGARYARGGDPAGALTRYERAYAISDSPEVRAEALTRASIVHRARCDWDLAVSTAKRAAGIAESSGLTDALAEALNAEAVVYQTRGDFDAAIPLLERVLGLTANDRIRGIAVQNLGAIAARQSDFAEAERRFLDSVEHFRRAEYDLGVAVALNNTAAAALDRRNWTLASDVAAQAQDAAIRIGDQELLGIATLNLAEARSRLGDLERAEAQASEALGLFRTAGNIFREIECLRLLGDVLRERDQPDTARRAWERGLELARRTRADPEAAQLQERLDRER